MGWSVQQKTVTEVLKKLLSACRFWHFQDFGYRFFSIQGGHKGL